MQESDFTPEPGDVTIESKESNQGPGRDLARGGRIAVDDFKASVKEFASRIPDQIGKAFESLQARAHAITVQVDEETQRKIDALVEAGVFKNRSESAAYLIHEGIKSRREVFDAIDARMAEIDRIRSDMRTILSPEPNE
jgi:Arc/MetJ-type ribon-helix-helix transcriptional regulator